jgi:hypothetical protein
MKEDQDWAEIGQANCDDREVLEEGEEEPSVLEEIERNRVQLYEMK